MAVAVCAVMGATMAHAQTASTNRAHGGPVTALAFASTTDGPAIYSGGFDGRVLAWSESLEWLGEILGGANPVRRVDVTTACSDSACRERIVASPDGTRYSAIAPTGTVEIGVDDDVGLQWRDRTGAQAPLAIGEVAGGILDIEFSDRPDGNVQRALILARGEPPRLVELDRSGWRSRLHPPLPQPGIAASSSGFIDDRYALLGSVDGQLGIVDVMAGEIGATAFAHEAPVTAIAVAADGRTAVTGGANGTLTLWSLQANQLEPLSVLSQFDFPILAVMLDETRDRVIVGHKSGHIEAVALDGQAGIKAPPRPARLFERADAESRGAKLFNACRACHSLAEDGDNKAGPTFYRLFGRRAGSVPGYPYSHALQSSQLIWTEETLSALFEHGPQRYLPGTKMPLQQLPDRQDRELLIRHIRQLTQASAGIQQ